MGTPVSRRFEELAWEHTHMGDISLRRRMDPALSSLFTTGELELARRGLAPLPGTSLDVVVGGLGLGYTARTVLEDPRVGSLVVVEALDEVIGWHRRGLLPFATTVSTDPRCRLAHGDLFALSTGTGGLDPERPDRRFHAILVDIDHSPSHLLHPDHAAFYARQGLQRLAGHLHPGGVFGQWSNDPPEDALAAPSWALR
jgi:spermidine synthase